MRDDRVSAVLVAASVFLLLALPGGEAEPAAFRASRGCGTAPPVAPGETTTRSIEVGGLDREYRLHLPAGYDRDTATSLVAVFHGYTSSARVAELQTTKMSGHADQHSYVVVYPQSTSFLAADGSSVRSWNDGSCNASPGPEGPICSEDADKYPHAPECGESSRCDWCTCHDDVTFVDSLLDDLGEALCLDLDRVYATGMSNGGMFVQRLGCDLPDRFAAIAPVAGTLARGFNCAPGPSTPISIMNFQGSRDRAVPEDGTTSSDGYYYTPAEDVLGLWAQEESQGCAAGDSGYPTSADGTLELACVQRDHCESGAEVVSCIWTGEHTWPRDGADEFGNRVIWEFFSKHSK